MQAGAATLRLRRITGVKSERESLLKIFETAPTYHQNISGQTVNPCEAQKNFSALPAGIGPEDKFFFGIYLGNRLIGCVDLIRGYPDRKTAMLGLLLLSEEFQSKGFGAIAYEPAY